MFKSLILAALLMAPLASFADCAELAERLNREFGNVLQDESRDRYSSCKVLPFDPSLTVVALANPRPPNDFNYDLTIAVVETAGEKLVARLDRKAELYSDADYLTGISIDTGLYVLAKGVRAFGVSASNAHGGGVTYGESSLGLYVLTNKTIKPVMDRIIMHRAVGSRESADCYRSESVTRTLATGAGAHSGYVDLILMEKNEQTDVIQIGEKCKEKRSTGRERYPLRFDGRKYGIPEALAKEIAATHE